MSKTYFLVIDPTQTDLDNSVQAASGNTKYIKSIIAKYHVLSPVGNYAFSNGVELHVDAVQIDANGIAVSADEVRIFAEGRLCQDWTTIPTALKKTVRHHEIAAGHDMAEQLEGGYIGISDADADALMTKAANVKVAIDSGYLSLALYEANALTVDLVFTQARKDALVAVISAYFVKFPLS